MHPTRNAASETTEWMMLLLLLLLVLVVLLLGMMVIHHVLAVFVLDIFGLHLGLHFLHREKAGVEGAI